MIHVQRLELMTPHIVSLELITVFGLQDHS